MNYTFQVVRWGIRNATSSAVIPYRTWRCHLPTVCSGCRLLCHPTSRHSLQPVQTGQGLDLLSSQSELALSSVVEMGFTDSQAEQICALSRFRGSNPKHALSTLTALFVLGLNPASVLKVIEKCPELYTVKEAQLQQRITNLRKLGLVEGEMRFL